MVGNNAVMTGEGQVVQLDVGTEHDALADRVDRTGVIKRLCKGRAIAIVAADAAVPIAVMIADSDRVATAQIVYRGTQTVADAGHLAVADEVVHLIEVEHHVVGAFTSPVDGLVDVLRHQVDDARVARRANVEVAHVDGRLLGRLTDLIADLYIHADGRAGRVVICIDVAVGIVVGIGIAIHVAIDVAVVGALGLALALTLALTLALCLSLQFALSLSLRFKLLQEITLVLIVVFRRFRRWLWHGVSHVRGEHTAIVSAPADLLRRQVNRCFRGWTPHWLTSV
jgi:hypothetical protein